MTLGERIKKRRQELEWTQELLAEKARISKGFVSDLENNKRNISAETLLDVARVLGLSLDYLMRGSEEETAARDMIEFPPGLAEVAATENLSFSQTLRLLRAQRQLLAQRTGSKQLALDNFDWRKFYVSVKSYL